ncbi:MAG: hypothetical protein AAF224_11765 [Pseudomonadota bacterium]
MADRAPCTLPSDTKNVQTIKTRAKLAGAACAALAAAGCMSGGKSLDVAGEEADYREQIGVYSNPAADPNGMDPVAAAAFWSVRYDQDPKDWNAAVNYSMALRRIGSVEQAVKVMSAAANFHSEEPAVAIETARALIEAGRAFEAVRHVQVAHEADPRDWRVLSVYGVALDQIGEHKSAQAKYELALSIAPGVVSLLNNKGLSYALDGNLVEAQRILRAAASAPGADARVRQNLALVLAIKGDMLEAERLARSDLPPQIADGNINYYRSLVVQPAYWQDFAADDLDLPAFDAAPAPAQAAPLKAAPVNAPSTAPQPAPLVAPQPVSQPTAEPLATAAPQAAPEPLAQPVVVDEPKSTAASAEDAPVSDNETAATPASPTYYAPLDEGPVFIDPLADDETVIDLKKIGN